MEEPLSFLNFIPFLVLGHQPSATQGWWLNAQKCTPVILANLIFTQPSTPLTLKLFTADVAVFFGVRSDVPESGHR